MPELLDEIETLERLNRLRAQVTQLRDAGIGALTSYPYSADQESWEDPGDQVEKALCLRVLHLARERSIRRGPCEEMNRKLWLNGQSGVLAITVASLFDNTKKWPDRVDFVPLLRASRVMQALALSPGGASDSIFSALWACYYRIMREIYYSGPTEWLVGAARAGEEAPATAFITGECVRAIQLLWRALDFSETMFSAIATFLGSSADLKSPRFPSCLSDWANQELIRQRLSLEVWIRRSLPGALFPSCLTTDRLSGESSALEVLWSSACRDVQDAARTCQEALRSIADFRNAENAARELGQVREYHASETAHALAVDLIGTAGDCLRRLEIALSAESWERANWKEASDALDTWKIAIAGSLEAPKRFLQSVLEQELAASGTPGKHVDAPELAFAAASYGELTGDWQDSRLSRAAKLLLGSLDDRGRFHIGRPMQVRPKGYRLDVVGGEVMQAIAEILARVEVPLSARFARKLLNYFRDTRAVDTTESPLARWNLDEPCQPGKGVWWVTAICVLALHQIVRMLDHRLNERIGKHFTFKEEQDLKLDLENLFYPDYGLASSFPSSVRPEGKSLSILLQRMRAHLLGVRLDQEPVFSLILHGPPGTGKTTIVEALAKSTRKRLFEITPSDILVGGADMIERRARAVFQALSMLTDSVILFDEFDPLLRRRDKNALTPSNVFEFLTPGMLPKLKTLHDRAEKQRVAFCLATNLIGSLDEAVIREGRFDQRLGVYPPDLLSRAGRLVHVVGIDNLDDGDKWDRVARCVQESAGGPMTRLGRPGWFSRTSSSPSVGTPHLFILTGGAPPEFPGKEAEFSEKPQGEGRDSVREWCEFGWIVTWDREFSADTWAGLAVALEGVADVSLTPFP